MASAKLAGPVAPAVAPTLYGPPITLFAVNAVAVATPDAFVDTTHVVPLQGEPKLPLGPDAGAWKVTLAFGMVTPAASRTMA